VLGPTPPIDGVDVERLDTLRDLDPGDTSYLDRAIANFQRNSAEAVASMRELAAAGDAAGLQAAAHKIAGSALNLGVEHGGKAARELELAVEAGGLDDAGPLLDRVDELFTEGRRLLAEYQAGYAG
jgi:HPt (histidine-containing phosphotransfer) domain-containing protein